MPKFIRVLTLQIQSRRTYVYTLAFVGHDINSLALFKILEPTALSRDPKHSDLDHCMDR